MDNLVDAITELVIKELEKASGSSAASAAKTSTPAAPTTRGPRLLMVAGPEPVPDAVWTTVSAARVKPSVLVWDGFGQEQRPDEAAGWHLETRSVDKGASRLVADYAGLCLTGSDLPVLGSIASLGAGAPAPASLALAAVAAGLPVFCEAAAFEKVRRHSARLAPGFVRAFEESWRTAASFGIELGTPAELEGFLQRLGGQTASGTAAAKATGRDVVTTEDVEAARRAGHKILQVAMGAIVTPLARQQAAEWGIEVKLV